MDNPDLIPPGQDPSYKSVPALTRFKNKVDGVYIESEANWSSRMLDVKRFYYSSMKSMNMFRPDGTRIPFIDHLFMTNIEGTVLYLDNEIDNGHSYIRRATEKEVEAFGIRTDPIGTITAGLYKTIEAKVRADIEEEMKKKYGIASDTAPAVVEGPTASEAQVQVVTELEALLAIPEGERTDIQRLKIRAMQGMANKTSTFQAGLVGSTDISGGAASSGK